MVKWHLKKKQHKPNVEKAKESNEAEFTVAKGSNRQFYCNQS